jgi:hypothetical protein
MNRQDKRTLDDLLRDLMSAQDDVTRLNVKGPKYAKRLLRAIRHRDEVRRRIVDFVERLDESIPF